MLNIQDFSILSLKFLFSSAYFYFFEYFLLQTTNLLTNSKLVPVVGLP